LFKSNKIPVSKFEDKFSFRDEKVERRNLINSISSGTVEDPIPNYACNSKKSNILKSIFIIDFLSAEVYASAANLIK
jgi:hypothetical protein